MIYSFDSRVRYSEVGPDKKLTLNSIINYFQDCSTFHSESIGLGLENLEKQHYVWMLTGWQIIVERAAELGEEIKIFTWPYEFVGFYGNRNFKMEDKQGNMIAYANSIWAFVNIETGHPTKVTEQELKGYELEEKLDMDYAPRKIKIPKEYESRAEFSIRRYHIDTNNHVNNGQYIQLAAEYLPENYKIRQMRAEYKKAAVYGDIITPKVSKNGNLWTVSLCASDERPYAVAEFTLEQE